MVEVSNSLHYDRDLKMLILWRGSIEHLTLSTNIDGYIKQPNFNGVNIKQLTLECEGIKELTFDDGSIKLLTVDNRVSNY